MAVGAPFKRLARQLATEAGLLVVVSALTGLLLSIWLSVYLRGLTLLRDAEWRNVTLLDWRVLSLAGAFVLVLTLLVSLAPILGIKRIGIAASSRQAAARASLAQAGTAQIAVAGAFGGAAIAFGWHMGELMFGDPGYEMNDRYFVRLEARIGNPESYVIGLARLRESIEAIPGVTAVAFGDPVPGEAASLSPVRTQDPRDPANTLDVYTGSLESRFVDVLGLDLLHGRVPNADESGFVVVVNQTLARALWGREDVIGERLTGDVHWGSNGSEVVGVLEDLSFGHPSVPVRPIAFEPLRGGSLSRAIVEAQLTPAELRRALDRLVAVGELEMQVMDVLSLRAMRNDLIAPDRARAFLTIVSAALVALLAAFGLYGTQRYLVTAGRREYAIRAALGAGPRTIGRLVVWRGLLLGLPGLAFGALLGFIVAAWLRDDFVSRDVVPALVGTCVVAGLILLLIAASLSPAREARCTQPAPVLRED